MQVEGQAEASHDPDPACDQRGLPAHGTDQRIEDQSAVKRIDRQQIGGIDDGKHLRRLPQINVAGRPEHGEQADRRNEAQPWPHQRNETEPALGPIGGLGDGGAAEEGNEGDATHADAGHQHRRHVTGFVQDDDGRKQ